MRLVVLVLAAAGCTLAFDASLLHRDAATSDGKHADGSAGSDALACYGTFQSFCLDAPPSQAVDVTVSNSIDTGMTQMCTKIISTADVDVCVVAVTSFTIEPGVTLTVHGPRALAIVATGPIEIDGDLDVASHWSSGMVGGGANAASCSAPVPPANGGGPGGSFRTVGGTGGLSATAAQTGGASAPGSPTALRGGCPGSVGGGGVAGSAGASGGALTLIASSIVVRGHVNASGAGAAPTSATGRGGSGGGSGGMLVFDAPDVQVPAGGVVLALGGGGAEGSSTAVGTHGGEADVTMPQSIPGGGSAGTATAGNGGDGGTGSNTPGTGGGGGSGAGGGGGGGAAGYIKCRDLSPTVAGSVDPAFG